MNKDTKKVFIKNFGCQMNIRDSEYVMGLMIDNGFSIAGSMKDADVIIFNSCSVRKHAEDRLFSNIAELRKIKIKKPGLIIVLMGCTAQNYKEELLRREPLIDLVCGTGNEDDLPRMIKDFIKNRCNIVAVDKVNETIRTSSPDYREKEFKTFVSIGEGCDNYCSYCIVPYVRGKERSRHPRDIIDEIRSLGDRNFKEVTLLGQNVNSYGKSRTANSKDRRSEFVKLLEKISKIEGIKRIRFMTSHPKDASLELFKAMGSIQKICGHLHLPLQSGSDRMLRLMNRGYTRKRYMDLIDSYRKYVPNGSITTDIIVGFPSETEKDYKASAEVMRNVGFDSAFMFKYSPRPPAKASRMADNVTSQTKASRLNLLIDLQCKISEEINRRLISSACDVLVDGFDEKAPSSLTGRTGTNKTVIFSGKKSLVGAIINVNIVGASPHTLKGEIVE